MGWTYTDGFNGFMAVGLLGPALLLHAGSPDIVCQGLASGPHDTWTKTPHGKFGLFAYTVSDIAVGGRLRLCDALLCKSPKKIAKIQRKFLTDWTALAVYHSDSIYYGPTNSTFFTPVVPIRYSKSFCTFTS